MSVKSREKIALVVFMGLILMSLVGLCWYLYAGHSWNVTASNLDDTFGSMEGYTALVYDGTAPVQDKAVPGSEDRPLDSTNEENDSAATGENTWTPGQGASAAGKPDAASSDGATTHSDSGNASPSKRKPLTLADAKSSYEDKGATVFDLDTFHPEKYREGVILKQGNHRFGVFCVNEPTSNILLDKQLSYFHRCKVDFIVALTANKEYVQTVSGIDIAIAIQDEEVLVMGETIKGTFYVDAPVVGSVGAIIISPNNVVSAKVIQEL